MILAELLGGAAVRFFARFCSALLFSFFAPLPLRSRRTTVCPSRTSESVSADPTSPLEPAITIFMGSPSIIDATQSEPSGQDRQTCTESRMGHQDCSCRWPRGTLRVTILL
jgi:hypothetical protein